MATGIVDRLLLAWLILLIRAIWKSLPTLVSLVCLHSLFALAELVILFSLIRPDKMAIPENGKNC